MGRTSDIAGTVRDPVLLASPNFAAVLLAGGRSTRMGRDKATLLIEGQPLWQRQLAILRALGPKELFISGPRDGPYADAGVEIIEDAVPGLGPLGGIAAALRRAESPLVLVLAIDLPAMTADFLITLLLEGRSVVPQNARYFEPLAAIYPRSALLAAEEMLREEDRSMQRFVWSLIGGGDTQARAINANESLLFQNVNRLGDLASRLTLGGENVETDT
jgi:molybdopterin-guanine dinucleotide biosynthesis protein A